MQGSIQKRVGKKGITWTVVVDAAPDPVTGKRRQKRLSAPTLKELRILQTKLLHEVNEGEYVEPAKMTVRQYLDRWLESLEANAGPATFYCHRSRVRQHLQPGLGHVQLDQLNPLQIQAFYAAKQKVLSPRMVRHIHTTLNKALNQAVAWRLLKHNPCASVDRPKPKDKEQRTWSRAEAQRFLDATETHRHGLLWRVALATGLRRGELQALHWEDVDLERGSLTITRTVYRGAKGTGIGPTKTGAGRRII
jgi:Phage integrase, N-terminal SAM-like domain/Phage integrase family